MIALPHPHVRVVGLPELNLFNDRELVLNWIGQARRHPKDPFRLQVFARFLDVKNGSRHDVWVSLERICLLILESHWRGGIMVGKPLGVRQFSLKGDVPQHWITPTVLPQPGSICFGDAYPLSFDRPAAPVLEVTTSNDELLYMPLSELLRAHYFSVPRALPSLLGGQVLTGTLASKQLQAWITHGTGWVDREEGVAAIHRAHFVTDYQSACLARLLFSASGLSNLRRLRKWVETSFVEVGVGRRTENRADLPRLTLPYSEGQWNVVVRKLESAHTGQARYLVLQIVDFDVLEPYDTLVVTANSDPTETEPEAGLGGNGRAAGKLLTPIVPEPLLVDDEPSDPGMTPVLLEDILPMDRASRRRRIAKPAREARARQQSTIRKVLGQASAVAGSMRDSSIRGQGNVSCHPSTATSEWPALNATLQSVALQIQRALMPFLAAHRHCDIAASINSLPQANLAYSYEIPKNDSVAALARAYSRQFLVLHIEIAGRHAYVIDAERRLSSDAFPIGVLATAPNETATFDRWTTAHVECVARAFEESARESRSWVAHEQLAKSFVIRRVTHPSTHCTEAAVRSFASRVVAQIMALIGDARVVADIHRSVAPTSPVHASSARTQGPAQPQSSLA